MDEKGIKCPYCKAATSIDSNTASEAEAITCSYCGKTFRTGVVKKDVSSIRKTEHTIRTIDEARIIEARNESIRLAQENRSAFKKSGLCKAIIGFFVLGILMAMVGFSKNNTHGVKGVFMAIICSVQAVILGAAWLFGMNYISSKRNNIHIALAIIGFILVIPILALM